MRVRWGNVGRAAVVVGVLGLAVAWPRLAPEPPALPSDEGVPVASPTAAGEAARPPTRKAGRPKRRARKKPAKKRRVEKRRVERRRVERRRVERRQVEKRQVEKRSVAPRSPQPAPQVPVPAAPAPTARARPRPTTPTFTPQDPATTEFSFETG
jgi:hypothetical protein